MKNLVSTFALVACCIILTQCGGGGGGGGGDGSPSTIRPKTLDGITLALDNNATFRFTRSIASSPASKPGDVETGSFTYTGNSTPKVYNSTESNITNVVFPRSITTGRYTYRPTNSTAGTLTLTGDAVYTIPTRLPFPFAPVLYPFVENTFGNTNRTVTINITFVSSGSLITSNAVVLSVFGNNPANDSVIVPATVTLTGGGGVPTNYNPEVDPNRPSAVAPATLNNAFANFTSGTGNSAFDFSLQFAADASGGTMMSVDEIGEAILTVNGTIITNSEDYTYKRTPGTDNAVLVLGGSGSVVDGSYILEFSGTLVGTYTGSTPDLSGTFRLVRAGVEGR